MFWEWKYYERFSFVNSAHQSGIIEINNQNQPAIDCANTNAFVFGNTSSEIANLKEAAINYWQITNYVNGKECAIFFLQHLFADEKFN